MTRIFDKQGNYIKSGDVIGQQQDSLLHFSHPRVSKGHRAKEMWGTMSDALMFAKPNDTAMMVGNIEITVEVLRKLVQSMGYDPVSFSRLPGHEQDKIFKKVNRYVEKNIGNAPELIRDTNVQKARQERTDLHVSLREWAEGPLKLEHPQGSSYHHLLEYDKVSCTNDLTMKQIADQIGHPELIVVENDWAKVISELPGSDIGEVRMPFEHACWEFRISGVRVLTFVRTDETDFDSALFCVYGRNGIWVADDFGYKIVGHRLEQFAHYAKNDSKEFFRVAQMVWANIRASCIMLDAKVAREEGIAPSTKLVEKRTREGRSPPRSYAVVRLLRKHSGVSRPRTAVTIGERAPQGGHIRRGTWVHYDDQDSGKEQYPNDGGFMVSRTWRPWHFAGDLSRMIEREYRL